MKLLIIAGARPNFMKVAPLIKAIQRHNASLSTVLCPPSSDLSPLPLRSGERAGVRCSGTPSPPQPSTLNPQLTYKLIHTGQHYDAKMSDVFFHDLGIPAPDVNLEVGSGSHAVQTANIMTKFEPVCLAEKPDWVVVVGDVNSTMACTLVASKLGIRVAHVEAGLRSFDRTMPEEINRLVTDALADLLLTPSEDASENLRREGIPDNKIGLVGNIMIDALVENLQKARTSSILKQLSLEPGKFVYVTLHRPSNVDGRESLTAIMGELQKLAQQMPVVFPMHPRTRKMLSDFGITIPPSSVLGPRSSDLRPPSSARHAPFSASDGEKVAEGRMRCPELSTLNSQPSTFHILDPIGYHDSLCLTEQARLVLTDSGGLQEESTFFRTPCLTLRPNTERPVTVTLGSNRLTTIKDLHSDIALALKAERRQGKIPPLWDGKTAERIIAVLAADHSLSASAGESSTPPSPI